jgi:hypothetical protein
MRYGAGIGYGKGFGFRGYSPPWPYIGRGRGGLPRCHYPYAGAYNYSWYDFPPGQPYYASYGYYRHPHHWSWAPPEEAFPYEMDSAQTLDYLKSQAEILNDELDQLNAKIKELEGKE